mmetsp:Transcript_14502/g.33576  ORF Transcript_14502/g.33576 Transcript_14502/m.33576 type:complete len:291 (-) Transcript_14502:6372-7244(-)
MPLMISLYAPSTNSSVTGMPSEVSSSTTATELELLESTGKVTFDASKSEDSSILSSNSPKVIAWLTNLMASSVSIPDVGRVAIAVSTSKHFLSETPSAHCPSTASTVTVTLEPILFSPRISSTTSLYDSSTSSSVTGVPSVLFSSTSTIESALLVSSGSETTTPVASEFSSMLAASSPSRMPCWTCCMAVPVSTPEDGEAVIVVSTSKHFLSAKSSVHSTSTASTSTRTSSTMSARISSIAVSNAFSTSSSDSIVPASNAALADEVEDGALVITASVKFDDASIPLARSP